MEWISVQDKLPECYVDVLVFYSNGQIRVECLLSDGFICYSTTGPVTHWMPLPERPEV